MLFLGRHQLLNEKFSQQMNRKSQIFSTSDYCLKKCWVDKHIFQQTLKKNENCPQAENRLPNVLKIAIWAKPAEQKY